MTEEEFRALLKIEGDEAILEIVSETIWTAKLMPGRGVRKLSTWTCSTNKETAIKELAEKYFKSEYANTRK